MITVGYSIHKYITALRRLTTSKWKSSIDLLSRIEAVEGTSSSFIEQRSSYLYNRSQRLEAKNEHDGTGKCLKNRAM